MNEGSKSYKVVNTVNLTDDMFVDLPPLAVGEVEQAYQKFKQDMESKIIQGMGVPAAIFNNKPTVKIAGVELDVKDFSELKIDVGHEHQAICFQTPKLASVELPMTFDYSAQVIFLKMYLDCVVDFSECDFDAIRDPWYGMRRWGKNRP